jgi:programmed cell death protein 5
MENFASSKVNPGELPEGFSAVDPNNPSAPNAAGQQKQQMQEQRQMILEQACTQEALARLGRIKLVKPEKAASVENMIVSMAMQGKLPGRINEGKLIEILERGSMKTSGSQDQTQKISIQRKRYAFDSDDEDDDEDLL